jgi:hypothetical protein
MTAPIDDEYGRVEYGDLPVWRVHAEDAPTPSRPADRTTRCRFSTALPKRRSLSWALQEILTYWPLIFSHCRVQFQSGTANVLQFGCIPNARLHQHLWRAECPQQQNHLRTRADAVSLPSRTKSTAVARLPSSISRGHQCTGYDRQEPFQILENVRNGIRIGDE